MRVNSDRPQKAADFEALAKQENPSDFCPTPHCFTRTGGGYCRFCAHERLALAEVVRDA